MSTHKRIDKICCVVLAVTLVLTILFMNADSFKLQKTSVTMGYENKLFDTFLRKLTGEQNPVALVQKVAGLAQEKHDIA